MRRSYLSVCSKRELGPRQGLLLCILVVGLFPCTIASGQESRNRDVGQRRFVEHVQPFLKSHCLRCHGAKRANAGFRVDQLSTDFTAPNAAERWKDVVDMINLGEMPPEDEPRPAPDEFEPVVKRWSAK